MTIDTLTQTLQGYLTDTDGQHRLTLPAQNELASQDISTLIQQSLPGGTLVIDNVEQAASEQALVFTGRADLFNQQGLRVEALFYIVGEADQNTPQLTLTAHLPEDGWTFSQSFPAFTDTLIDAISLNKPCFLLASRDGAQAGPYANLQAGLNFGGEIKADSAALHQVGWLLPSAAPLLLSGPLKEAADPGQAPAMTLRTPEAMTDFSLGSAGLSTWITVESTYIDFPASASKDPVLNAAVDLCAQLDLGSNDNPIRIPLALALSDETYGSLTLWADARALSDIALSQLSDVDAFFEGTALSSLSVGDLIPDDFSLKDQVSFSWFLIEFSPLSKQITALDCGLQFEDVSWEMLPALSQDGPALCQLDQIVLALRLDDPLSPARDGLTACIEAVCVFAGVVRLAGSIALPGKQIRAFLDGVVDLGALVNQFYSDAPFPDNLLSVYKLDLSVDPVRRTFYLSSAVAGAWSLDLGVTELALTGLALEVYSDGAIGGMIEGAGALAGADVQLAAKLGDAFTLEGSVSEINLTAIAETFLSGASLPDEVPDVEFSDLKVSLTPSTGSFSFSGTGTAEWEGQSAQVDLSLTRTVVPGANGQQATSEIDCTIILTATGPFEVADELALNTVSLAFTLDKTAQGSAWSLAGDVAATVFDTDLQLQASYETAQGQKALTLSTSIAPALDVVSLDDLGALSLSGFSMALTKAAAGANGQPAGSSSWSVSASGRVVVAQACDLAGTLTLFKKDDGSAGLIFAPTEATASVPLPIPDVDASLDLSFGGISVARGGQPGSGWSFAASVDAAFKGLPDVVDDVLPEVIATTFSADKDGVRLTLARVLDPVEFTISNKLGTASIALTNLMVALQAQTDVSMQLGVGLPASLNKLFGVDGNKARYEVFRTYQEGDETSLVQVRLGMGPDGVSFTFLSSPLEAIEIVQEGAYSYFYVDLDDCGKIKFRVPVFRYDAATSSFEANGGFLIVEPLQIPFGLFKDMLAACGLGDAADLLPDGVPFVDVDLADEQGRLKVDALIDFLSAAGDVPDEIGDALSLVGDATERLPDGFTDYLKITIPDALFFDIAVRPDGSMKGALRTYDKTQQGAREQAKPVRAIYPTMVSGLGGAPMPGFNGIQLRSVAFGPLAGGALLQLEIDGRLDQYDMATLAASLLLPSAEAFPLPTSDELQKTLILDNVFMVLSTALPIPIPIFYDEIGVEYLGLEGVTLQGHAQFPKPKVSAAALAKLFGEFKEFFEDRDALLDPKDPPGGINLVFGLKGNYIQLPEYLGSGVLGPKDKLPPINAYENVAHLLNGLKTLSLNELLQAIPLQSRVGSKEVRFAFLSADADWLITTPGEFMGGAYNLLELSKDDRSDFMKVLPAVGLGGDGAAGTVDEEGLVVFLRGQAGVRNVVTLETVFGLVASGSMGFNTGFKFSGTLAEFIDMELGGSIAINAPTDIQTAPAEPDPVLLPETTPHALSFNGSSSCFKAQPFDGFPDKALTVEGWVKVTDKNKACALLSYANKETDNAFLLFDPRNLEVNVNGAKVKTGVALNDGKWHHLAVSWELDTEVRDVKVDLGMATMKVPQVVTFGKVLVYKDGKAVFSGEIVPGKRIADGGALVLGQEQDRIGGGFSAKQAFKGRMDEVRLWNRVRTADEIKGDMNRVLSGREAGLIGYWPLDDGDGATATDLTWRNHGALTNTAWVAANLPRPLTRDALDFEGLYLDGNKGRVVVDALPTFSTNEFTAECWIKSSDKSKKGSPLSYANSTSTNAFLLIDHRNLEVLVNNEKVQAGVSFDDGQWHHLAVVWKSGEIKQKFLDTTQRIPFGQVKVYKDGKQVFKKSGVAVNEKLDGGGLLVLGQDQDRIGGGFQVAQAFKGTIQDVRLWRTARSGEQIRTHMGRQLTGDEKGLIGYWPLDEDAGAEALDKTAHHNHGTITGGLWGRVDVPAVPDVPDSAAIQLYGYSRLDVFDHNVFKGDIRLVDDTLWFRGRLDLFPGDDAFDVRGNLEGLLSPEKFYLAGDARVVMAGITLSRAQAVLSNDLIRLQGRWLGFEAAFEASEYEGALQLKGEVGFDFDMKVDFGELGTLKVDVGASLGVTVNKDGFRARVEAHAEVNGKGVSVDGFTLHVAPSDLAALKDEIRKRLLEDPLGAIADFFEDAGEWLAAIGSDLIDWTGNAIEDVGQGLHDLYDLSSNGAARALEGAGYAAKETGKALKGAFTNSTYKAAEALEAAGYAAEDVGKALKGTFTSSTTTIGRALKAANFSSKDVGKAMKAVGASAKDVANFMKDVWGKGDDAVKDILKGAGYSSKAVEGAMKDVFNWGKDAWKKATSWMP